MPGVGTLVNAIAIIAAGATGCLAGNKIPQKMQDTLMKANALAVLFLGVAGVIAKMLTISDGSLSTSGTMMMVISLALGAVVGELLDIEEIIKGEDGKCPRQEFCECFCHGLAHCLYRCHGRHRLDPGRHVWRPLNPVRQSGHGLYHRSGDVCLDGEGLCVLGNSCGCCTGLHDGSCPASAAAHDRCRDDKSVSCGIRSDLRRWCQSPVGQEGESR